LHAFSRCRDAFVGRSQCDANVLCAGRTVKELEATARAIKARLPACRVEVLVPDFQGSKPAMKIVNVLPCDVVAAITALL